MLPLYYHFDKSRLPIGERGDWQERISNPLLWPAKAFISETVRINKHGDGYSLSVVEKVNICTKSLFAVVSLALASPVVIPCIATGGALRYCSKTYFDSLRMMQHQAGMLSTFEPLSTYEPPTHLPCIEGYAWGAGFKELQTDGEKKQHLTLGFQKLPLEVVAKHCPDEMADDLVALLNGDETLFNKLFDNCEQGISPMRNALCTSSLTAAWVSYSVCNFVQERGEKPSPGSQK